VSSLTLSVNSEPLSASRTALVARITGSETPFSAAMRTKRAMALAATSRRPASIFPVFSTPDPSRAETFSPFTGRTAFPSTSPTRRWIVFDPTSITECRLKPPLPSTFRRKARELPHHPSYNPALQGGIFVIS
jgi:hypothetical protein